MKHHANVRCALTIAGSDSIGGAGIQADIKAMASVGVHALTVITAITAQNTCSVNRIMPVPCDMIRDQIGSVFSDSDVRAVKTGMLYDREIVRTVVDEIESISVPIVVDPVLVAGVGDSLAADDLVRSLKEDLIPICDILTPNRYEAEALTGMKINNEDDVMMACEVLGKGGATIYLKGGHMDSKNVVDTLYNGAEFKRFEYPRLERAGHGGGCTLSSYITAHLASGMDVINSIIRSRAMIQQSIAKMYAVGKCDKVVNPLVIETNIHQDPVRTTVLTAINEAADKAVKILPQEWIPSKGTNIAFATKSPKGPQDIAGIEGKITSSAGKVKKNGNAKFNVSPDSSKAIMTAVKHDNEQRAMMNLRSDRDLVSIAEEVGLSILTVNGKLGDWPDLASRAIKKNGAVPDIMLLNPNSDKGVVVILGKDPEDLIMKLNCML